MTDTDDINPGRQDRQDRQRRIASLALAGLQKPAYAGVFRAMPKSKDPAWACELPLNGYNRHLTITVYCRSVRTAAGDTALRYRGRMTGLRPFFDRRDFDLVAPTGGVPDQRLIGRLDLHVARLSVSVLQCKGAESQDLMIGLLEVQREPPSDRK